MVVSIASLFIRWYLFDAPGSILRIWRNYLIWAGNLFSIDSHLGHLFSPWRKTVELYRTKGLDVGAWVDSVLMTNFSRLLGFIVRLVTIGIGLGWTFIIFVIGAVIFIGWYLLPLFIIYNFSRF
ncbi:hypothetical protein C4553_02235 [Candidatus Parcubacteria bacterium]|nr:MAG: hypothetical protein C4553_02235 [Candidatus Parcubacteria bacterium]